MDVHLGQWIDEIGSSVVKAMALVTLAELVAFYKNAFVETEQRAFWKFFQKRPRIAIVFAQNTHEVMIGATAGRCILQMTFECAENIGGEHLAAHERAHQPGILSLPICTMWILPTSCANVCGVVRELVDQGYEKAILVQVRIHTYSMRLSAGCAPVIAKLGLPGFYNANEYRIASQPVHDYWIGSRWDVLAQLFQVVTESHGA